VVEPSSPTASQDNGDPAEANNDGARRELSHPLLAAGPADAKRSADMLSRTDEDGYGWTIEEGWGAESEGRTTRVSGLTRVRKIKSTAARRQWLNRNKPPRSTKGERPRKSPLDKIDPELLVDGTDALVDVGIRVAKVDRGTIDAQLMALMLEREVTTPAELQRWREWLMEERAADIAAVQAPVRRAIDSLGGEVTYAPVALFGLNARISRAALLELSALPEVEIISAFHQTVDSTNGVDVANGTQITQFIDDLYDGENALGDDSHVAVIEQTRLREEHLGFLEGAGLTERIASRTQCDAAGCAAVGNWAVPGPAPEQSHATLVTGLVLGDLRDGQDPGVAGALGRERRSGYAGEARLHMYRNVDGTAGMRTAFDHIAARNGATKPRLTNLSQIGDNDDPDCLGESMVSMDANDVFEAGTLIIAAAGNEGHGDLNDCLVDGPAAAIGVFTVAGHGNHWTENETDVRSGAIYSLSGRGGTATEGKGRTIIDVSAYACRELLFDAQLGYAGLSCGTSLATATVTAAAVDYASWYRTFNGSTFIDDPGVMFTALLIQGDRQQAAAGLLTSEFSRLWGAGRLKMRKGDDAGMDSPTLWRFGSTCVGDGQEVPIPINGGAVLQDDVDDLKAVIYWYDPQHEVGIQIDDIDLYLEDTSGAVLRSSDTVLDNKERVYRSDAGGTAYQLRLVGADVTYDGFAPCGANSMLVYWSYFYEDDDRDDANGPTAAEIDPE
jgi:hypothetical protein